MIRVKLGKSLHLCASISFCKRNNSSIDFFPRETLLCGEPQPFSAVFSLPDLGTEAKAQRGLTDLLKFTQLPFQGQALNSSSLAIPDQLLTHHQWASFTRAEALMGFEKQSHSGP